MLRYIYFVSLLLCISLSEEEYLRSGKRFVRNSNRNAHSKGKINRKREDYEIFDNKDPVAHIDVASFIQSPDDASIENQPFEEIFDERKEAFKDSADFIPVINADAGLEKDGSPDYQSLESNKMPEANIYSKKHIAPQYVNINTQPVNGINNRQFSKPKNTREDDVLRDKYNSNLKKKCVFKNMKIPFFSHDKAKSNQKKKNKKRKLFGFCSNKKSTISTKASDSVQNTKYSNKVNEVNNGERQKSFKVNKRSYFERLCPACRQKFILGSNTDWLDKCRRTANHVIHNSRQYYANKKYDIKNTDNIEETNNYESKQEKQDSKNEDINDSTDNDRIWKRSK